MSFCPVIEIFPLSVTHFADSDGRVILDIDDNTTIALKKELIISDENISVQVVRKIAITVPNTPKNNFYLRSIFDPNADVLSTSIKSRISTGSSNYLYDKLTGISKSSTELEIMFELESDWIKLLKETKLKDITLPVFEFSQEDVEDKWSSDGLFTNGDDGYFFPIVNFGGWLSKLKKALYVEDLRPQLSPIYLLKQMFAHIGWCVESPFYETDFGRRLWCYLLKKDYNNNDTLKDTRKFFARNTWSAGYSQELGLITDWTEDYDNGNNFDEDAGIIETTFGGSITITFKTDNTVPGAIDAFRIRVTLFNATEGAVLLDQQFGMEANDEFQYKIDNINALPGMQIHVELSTTGSGVGFNALSNNLELTLSNDVKTTFHIKGDMIDMSKEVDQDMTCWELFTGFQHCIFGIADELATERKIILYTPHDADIFGENIDGYFNQDLFRLQPYQPINTVQSKVQINNSRFINIGFKESTDAIFKDKRNNNNEYFLKSIDLGSDAIEETEEFRNPVFEGTDIKLEDFILDPINGVYLPYMVDNEDGEISYNIAPRILYCKGVGVIGQASAFAIIWENVVQEDYFFMPFCFNSPKNTLIEPFQTVLFAPSSAPDVGFEVEEKFIYGNEVNDLWSLAIGKFYVQLKGRIQLDALVEINVNDYEGMSLKKVYELEFEGHPISGRILTINDFRPCSEISTQILFLPEKNIGTQCFDSVDEVNCDNRPYITITITGNCYTFAVSGTFVCEVFTITWEYKSSETGGEWTPLGTGSSAEVCDHPVTFIVRAVIDYDCEDCPDSIITRTVNPCFNTLQCRLTKYVNDLGQICVQYELIGQAPSYTFEVVVNGGEYTDEPLIDPFIICGLEENTEYIFTTTVTFDNGCDPLELTCRINTGDQPACDNIPVLECIQLEDGCYVFQISGTLSGEVETFIVTWECDGAMGTWLPGDDPVCCSGVITASAVVFICGCESVCTSEIQCDPGGECMLVDAGTPLLFAVCN